MSRTSTSTSTAQGFMTPSNYVLSLSAQDIPPPQAPPPTLHEKICCQRYCALRDRIHEGPLYTVLDDNVKTVKKRKERGSPPPEPGAVMDPFTGTETYSSRYMKKKKTMPKLDARPYGTADSGF